MLRVLVVLLCVVYFSGVGLAARGPCSYRATDGSLYDLSELMQVEDFVTSTVGSMELFYFAVCRDTHTCKGAACSMLGEESHQLGSLQALTWSEQFTHHGKGISLVYGEGESPCEEEDNTSFTITFFCDQAGETDALLLGFQSECEHNRASVKSRFACPILEENAVIPLTHSDDLSEPSASADEVFVWAPWMIVVGLLAGLLVMSIFVAMMVALKFRRPVGAHDLPLVEENEKVYALEVKC